MRKVLDTYLAAWYPSLDTRPGSVFGDLHLTPLAMLMASTDIAVENVLSDLDPTQLASGIVFDNTFARNYLMNFGILPRDAVATTGVLVFSFTTDKAYVLNRNASFVFGPALARGGRSFSVPQGVSRH